MTDFDHPFFNKHNDRKAVPPVFEDGTSDPRVLHARVLGALHARDAAKVRRIVAERGHVLFPSTYEEIRKVSERVPASGLGDLFADDLVIDETPDDPIYAHGRE